MKKFIKLVSCAGISGSLIASEADRHVPAELRTMADYRALAMPDERMRGLELMEVKFIMTGLEGESPKMNFLDTRRSLVHFEYIRKQLGIDPKDYLSAGSPGSTPRKYFGGMLIYWP